METRQQEQYSSVLSEAVLDWASMGPDGEWVNSNPHEGPQDRGHLSAGLDSQPLQEADEDLASEINLSNSTMTEEEREEIQQELTKLEEEISTLKQVLSSKEKQHAELKDKLGLTPLSELRNNFSRGWQDMTNSTAYKKTSETLSTAGQKTTAAFSNLGTALSRKLGDMRQRLEGQDLEAVLKMFCHLQQTPVTRTRPLTASRLHPRDPARATATEQHFDPRLNCSSVLEAFKCHQEIHLLCNLMSGPKITALLKC
ncbi:tumor protein D53 isoform X3 [Boleophthalmus pectinirostris]|uniref:tumor protein D53 isoform X3 n=2 Tax=Boleophthalmus pectinirostris TaxID=150288 RepID=UPI002433144A|nr:tumor protein D53 isoform X3 [Boleophthalmus pectinirostris]